MKALACLLLAVLATTWPSSAALAIEFTLDDVTSRHGDGAFALDGLDAAGLHTAADLLVTTQAPSEMPGAWHDLQAVTLTHLLSGGVPAALAIDDVEVGSGPNSVAEPGTLAMVLLTALGGGAVVLTRRWGGSTRRS